jgi:hypothetical protein
VIPSAARALLGGLENDHDGIRAEAQAVPPLE